MKPSPGVTYLANPTGMGGMQDCGGGKSTIWPQVAEWRGAQPRLARWLPLYLLAFPLWPKHVEKEWLRLEAPTCAPAIVRHFQKDRAKNRLKMAMLTPSLATESHP